MFINGFWLFFFCTIGEEICEHVDSLPNQSQFVQHYLKERSKKKNNKQNIHPSYSTYLLTTTYVSSDSVLSSAHSLSTISQNPRSSVQYLTSIRLLFVTLAQRTKKSQISQRKMNAAQRLNANRICIGF